MKNVRYVLLLPIIHTLLAVIMICRQDVRVWQSLPQQLPNPAGSQAVMYDNNHVIMWVPCYEFHMRDEERYFFIAEMPTGILFGSNPKLNECHPNVVMPLLRKAHTPPKVARIILDLLLTFGILGQWWLIGYRIDKSREQSNTVRRWIIPSLWMTVAAILMASAQFVYADWHEEVALLSGVAALIGWLVLLTILGIDAIGFSYRKIRGLRV
ncbi:MAG TPA: hypothetical protein VGF44_12085 [Terriglobales bacterium]|jgi:hypothetical protein